MKTRLFCSVTAVAAVLLLTGCVDRATADARLARGCVAGLDAMLPDGMKIGTIHDRQFTPSPEGQNFRRVTLRATATDGWIEDERDFVCVFEESFGFMNASHTAAFYQLRISDDEIYGKSGNEILGNAQDFIRLTDAIRKAMYE